MVLKGSATFYGAGDVELATLGENEGIHVPRRFQYWFENSGDGPLELLHVAARLPGLPGSDRMDAGEVKLSKEDKEYVDGSVR